MPVEAYSWQAGVSFPPALPLSRGLRCRFTAWVPALLVPTCYDDNVTCARIKTSGIYAIQRGERSYIGSSADITLRWRKHRSDLRGGRHHSRYLQNAWNKYGEDAFEFVILEECPVDVLIEREQHYLDAHLIKYNRSPTAGSQLGVVRSPETREKISSSLMGHAVSPETREKLRSASRGNTNRAGQPVSLETRAKMSESRKRRETSSETRAKMSASQRGRKHSPETKAKMSAAAKGRTVSAETRSKLSTAAKAQWERQRAG